MMTIREENKDSDYSASSLYQDQYHSHMDLGLITEIQNSCYQLTTALEQTKYIRDNQEREKQVERSRSIYKILKESADQYFNGEYKNIFQPYQSQVQSNIFREPEIDQDLNALDYLEILKEPLQEKAKPMLELLTHLKGIQTNFQMLLDDLKFYKQAEHEHFQIYKWIYPASFQRNKQNQKFVEALLKYNKAKLEEFAHIEVFINDIGSLIQNSEERYQRIITRIKLREQNVKELEELESVKGGKLNQQLNEISDQEIIQRIKKWKEQNQSELLQCFFCSESFQTTELLEDHLEYVHPG